MDARPSLVLARAAVFTLVCLSLGAAAHTAASGMAVPLWTVPVAAAALLGPASALCLRERSLSTIVAATVGCEAGLHELFMYGQMVSGHPMAGHADTSVVMLLGHLVAGLFTGWWLWRGERAAWRLLRAAHLADGLVEAIRPLLRHVAGEYVAQRPPPVVVASRRTASPRTRVPHVGFRLRGPPRPPAPVGSAASAG